MKRNLFVTTQHWTKSLHLNTESRDRLEGELDEMGQRVSLAYDNESTMDSQVDSVGTVNSRPAKNGVYWPNDQKVSTPTKFNVEDSEYAVKEFKFSVESFIMNHPPVSEGPILDYDVISWIRQLLSGQPGRWWTTFGLATIEDGPSHRTDLKCFWEQLELKYGAVKKPFEDELVFINMTQGSTSISEFNKKFRQMSAIINWNDKATLEAALYISKMNETFFKHLKSTPPLPKTFEGLMLSTDLFDPTYLTLFPSTRKTKEAVSSKTTVKQKFAGVKKNTSNEITCFNCGKVGHYKNQCKEKEKETPKPKVETKNPSIETLDEVANTISPISLEIENGAADCMAGALVLMDADSLVEIESEDESLDTLNLQLIKANDLESSLHVADLCPTISDEIVLCSAVRLDEDRISLGFSAVKADIIPEHRKFDCEIEFKSPELVPPFRPIYNLSEVDRKELRLYIEDMLAKGFIRPSKSPAGAGVFFVRKKDSSKRLCVGYRWLNELKVRNLFQLPMISDLADRLRYDKVFTNIDLRGAYNLVRINPGDEWKTALRCAFGHFEYTVMPFGLANAPAIFQRMMTQIFRDILDVYVVVYIDDLLIFSESEDEHEDHVKEVLRCLRENQLYAKLSKFHFHFDSERFLGFVI